MNHMKSTEKKLFCSFYKFTRIKNIYLLKKKIHELENQNSITGTILIAKEGINASVYGGEKILHLLLKLIKDFFEINSSKLQIKYFFVKISPFSKFKVKIKKQIIRFSDKSINPAKNTGKYIDPLEWNSKIANKNAIIIDTRNQYESDLGFFKNSTLAGTESFSEFSKWFISNMNKFTGKKIYTYCTGGIRCEKATSFILKHGFEEVYQLKGGILNYFKNVEKKESFFKGECFVFDDRVTLNHKLEKGIYNLCFACGNAINKNDYISKYYEKGVSCPKCFYKITPKKRESFRERQKQIKIAKKKKLKRIA